MRLPNRMSHRPTRSGELKMSNGGEILSAIFDFCPSDWFDQRVNGRRPNDRIRGTIPRPNDALALLKRRFSDQDLIAAGVAKPAFGELQIVSALCQTGGAVMALRKNPKEPPFDIMTGRGSLTGVGHSVISALEDSRRAALVEETGMMLAARRIKDVAMLDLLDLPATPGFGLSGVSLSDCQEIDTTYGEGIPTFGVSEYEHDEEDVDAIDVEDETYWETPASDESEAFRPMLVLIDQFRHRPETESSNWLRNTARWFAKIRRHTRLRFDGVWIWQPDDDFTERFQFAFQLKDRAQIREVILQSLTSSVDIESFTESAVDQSDAGPNYLTARKDLIHQLGVGAAELAADSGRFADSLQDYDSAVRTELAEPLINWAQKNTNPTISVVGSQLAEVVTLLHRITPRLHALQLHRLEEFSGSDGASLGSGLFSDYMRLLDRFSRLSSEIIRWMTA